MPDVPQEAVDLRQRITQALDASEDACPRCKTCDVQVDAVMAVRDEEMAALRAEVEVLRRRVVLIDQVDSVAIADWQRHCEDLKREVATLRKNLRETAGDLAKAEATLARVRTDSEAGRANRGERDYERGWRAQAGRTLSLLDERGGEPGP